jgi:hypothetical protein
MFFPPPPPPGRVEALDVSVVFVVPSVLGATAAVAMSVGVAVSAALAVNVPVVALATTLLRRRKALARSG